MCFCPNMCLFCLVQHCRSFFCRISGIADFFAMILKILKYLLLIISLICVPFKGSKQLHQILLSIRVRCSLLPAYVCTCIWHICTFYWSFITLPPWNSWRRPPLKLLAPPHPSTPSPTSWLDREKLNKTSLTLKERNHGNATLLFLLRFIVGILIIFIHNWSKGDV